jgi:hypothetical protein
MTRSFQTPFLGSLATNGKRLLVISALLFSGSQATESKYNLRIHKNLIKEAIDKNLDVVLAHAESQEDKDVFLTDIDATINNLDLRVKPKNGDWNKIESDLFFDQGQIVMEIAGLEFSGLGSISDRRSGRVDDIKIKAEVDLAQLVLNLEQDLTEDGFLHPKVEISEVALTLHPDLFQVEASGDLPLYKSHRFEEGIKKWMKEEIHKREKNFQKALQKVEREIMTSFAF